MSDQNRLRWWRIVIVLQAMLLWVSVLADVSRLERTGTLPAWWIVADVIVVAGMAQNWFLRPLAKGDRPRAF